MKNKFNQFIKELKQFFNKKRIENPTPYYFADIPHCNYPLYCERTDWSIDYGYGHE
jgi:hypothetical protein